MKCPDRGAPVTWYPGRAASGSCSATLCGIHLMPCPCRAAQCRTAQWHAPSVSCGAVSYGVRAVRRPCCAASVSYGVRVVRRPCRVVFISSCVVPYRSHPARCSGACPAQLPSVVPDRTPCAASDVGRAHRVTSGPCPPITNRPGGARGRQPPPTPPSTVSRMRHRGSRRHARRDDARPRTPNTRPLRPGAGRCIADASPAVRCRERADADTGTSRYR